MIVGHAEQVTDQTVVLKNASGEPVAWCHTEAERRALSTETVRIKGARKARSYVFERAQ